MRVCNEYRTSIPVPEASADALAFTIEVKPITKKNSQRMVKVNGRTIPLPSKAYVQYEKDAKWYMPKMSAPIDYPVNVKALYYMPTRRIVDIANLHGALHDILVAHSVLADDNSRIVAGTDGSRVLLDKGRPRTEVTITRVTT